MENSAITTIHELLDALVRERQRLRAEGAEFDELERNRCEIVRLQRELADALLARYLDSGAAAVA